ncbi:MAG: hypothetical protein ACMG6S_13820 [Byssovorax sp.]
MKLRVPAALLALITGAVVSCDDGLVHTFFALPYDVTLGCLGSSRAIDVIDGPDPGSCAEVHCWVKPTGEIFVSDRACDAPLDFTESASGPCKLAIDAYKKRVICAEPVDAGGS